MCLSEMTHSSELEAPLGWVCGIPSGGLRKASGGLDCVLEESAEEGLHVNRYWPWLIGDQISYLPTRFHLIQVLFYLSSIDSMLGFYQRSFVCRFRRHGLHSALQRPDLLPVSPPITLLGRNPDSEYCPASVP